MREMRKLSGDSYEGGEMKRFGMSRKHSHKSSGAGLLLSAVLFLGACGTEEAPAAVSSDAVPTTAPAVPTEEPVEEPKVLKVGCGEFSGIYDGLFTTGESDALVAELTQQRLLDKDRSGDIVSHGIEGETRSYNGSEYSYKGIADCEKKKASDGSVNYELTLKEGLCFSDGEPLTADDVIFTWYVLSDPSYNGPNMFRTLPVEGMDEYRLGSKSMLELILEGGEENTRFVWYTQEQQERFFTTDLPAAGEAFAGSISDYCLENGIMTGIDAVDSHPIANAMVNWGIAALGADGSVTAQHSGTVWTMQGNACPTAADFFEELMIAYSGDVLKLSEKEAADHPLQDFLPEWYLHTAAEGVSTASLKGIKKTGDYSVTLTLTQEDARAEELLGGYVLPFHYYGDPSYYDYDKNRFGFPKGDLDAVKAKGSMPLGAGPLILENCEEGKLTFSPNCYYHAGEVSIGELTLISCPEEDRLSMLQKGELDLFALPAEREMLETAGKDLAIRCRNLPEYDLIAINCEAVSVSGNAASDESVYLRRAISTVLWAYRDAALQESYGSAVLPLAHPLYTDGRMLWTDEENAAECYGTDVKGKEIFSEGMSIEERGEAAKKAALGYFEAAGYTVEDGVLTAAPDRARLEYEVIVIGGGVGDDPAYPMLKQASETLAELGLTLSIRDISDPAALKLALEGGKTDLWVESRKASDLGSLYPQYYPEGGKGYRLRIFDERFDELIFAEDAETDRAKKDEDAKKCLEFLTDYGAVIPLWQYRACTVYAAERVDESSLISDETVFYDWTRELTGLTVK